MTTTTQTVSAGSEAPTFPRLVNAELRRLLARRFTRFTLALSLVGFVVAIAFIWLSHSQVTPADTAQATAARDQQIVQFQQYVDDCLKGAGGSAANCGQAPTADQFPIDQFLINHPFQPRMVADYSMAVGIAAAMAGFLIAATFIGAEWSSKNIVSWLFYEPRRLRLMGAKIVALCSVLLPLALLAQILWWVCAKLLLAYRGVEVSTLGEPQASHFWTNIVGVQIRAFLLVLPLVLLGFGLANLIRNTAAALGVAFVYLAVVESVARAISPGLQPYLFTNGVAAWVNHGGITVYGDPVFDQQQGYVMPVQIELSNLHGAIVLVVFTAVVLGVSLLLFRRRDIA